MSPEDPKYRTLHVLLAITWTIILVLAYNTTDEPVLSIVYRAISIPIGLCFYGQINTTVKYCARVLIKLKIVKRIHDNHNPPKGTKSPFDNNVSSYRWLQLKVFGILNFMVFIVALYNPQTDQNFILAKTIGCIIVVFYLFSVFTWIKFISYLDKQDEYLRSWALKSKS